MSESKCIGTTNIIKTIDIMNNPDPGLEILSTGKVYRNMVDRFKNDLKWFTFCNFW